MSKRWVQLALGCGLVVIAVVVASAFVDEPLRAYVEQILLRLRRAGVIKSTRGARGGYSLAKPPAETTIREVIQASELETFDLHCVSHPVETDRCSASHLCSIRPVWVLLQKKIDDVLDGVSLADLLHDEPVVRERVGLPNTPKAREKSLPILQGV